MWKFAHLASVLLFCFICIFSAYSHANNSVYDPYLKNELLVLKGNKLTPHSNFQAPQQYYLFYKAASWCPACRQYTPALAKYYKDLKAYDSENWELIYISNDDSTHKMSGFAAQSNATWPHLSLKGIKTFEQKFKLPGSGIPNLILMDTNGNILKASYERGKYVGPGVVLEELSKRLAALKNQN